MDQSSGVGQAPTLPLSTLCQEDILPLELWQKTFEFLSPWDIIRISGTCRTFRGVSQDDVLWKGKVSRALNDQALLEEVNELALIYLTGKFRPMDGDLGYRLGAKTEDRISKKVTFTPLEEFILSHVRLYFILDIKFCSDVIAYTQPNIPVIQRLISEQNPFAIFSQGLEALANNKMQEAKKAFKKASPKVNMAAVCLATCNDPADLHQLITQGNGLANYYYYLSQVKVGQDQGSGWLKFINSCRHLWTSLQGSDTKGVDEESYLMAAAKGGFLPAEACFAQKLFFTNQLAEGLFLALKAAKKNCAEAKMLLGKYYHKIMELKSEDPESFPKEQIEALDNLKGAADRDYFMLGRIDVLIGNLSVEEQEVHAVWADQPLTRLGWTPYLLCLMYIKGSILPKNMSKALEYYNQFRSLSPKQMEQLPEINKPEELLKKLPELHQLVLDK